MAGTEMQEVLEMFGSVTKMLTGKIYPQSVCSLRLINASHSTR